jgi:hypothetical protein
MFSGRCLYGGIRFEIRSSLAPIQGCHCSLCRKVQGGPFATNTPVELPALHFLSGENRLTSYELSPGKERCFCSRCGSPIFSRKDSLPNIVRVRAGLINESFPVKPEFHAFVGSTCIWWQINDTLPHFDGFQVATPGA